MTTAQVKAKIPQAVFGRENEFGTSKTSINPAWDPQIDKNAFAGIRTISLDFLDGRLTSLWIGYDSSFKWQTIADFVSGISQGLRLPDAWTPWKSRGKLLKCVDFQMTVTTVAESPSFHIIDTTAEETLAERRQTKEEQDSAAEEESMEAIVADRESKVYYSPGCVPASDIKEANRAVFRSVAEAQQAGYKLATQCHE
ncbi:MAG: hypothetical protein ABR501_03425 [Pyrinomonadaceae bacterium]